MISPVLLFKSAVSLVSGSLLAICSCLSVQGIQNHQNLSSDLDGDLLNNPRSWRWSHEKSIGTWGRELTISLRAKKEDKDWSCNLKGTIPDPTRAWQIDVDSQLGDLKRHLSTNNPSKMKIFLKNCAKHRNKQETTEFVNSRRSTIHLGTLRLNGGKYMFDRVAFRNLYLPRNTGSARDETNLILQ